MRPSTMIGIGLIVALLAVGAAIPAAAGGWAVVTLDSLPEGVVPGVDFTVGFTVRQHGVTLLSDLNPAPVVTAKHTESSEVVRSIAAAQGGPGHYTAQLSLPSPGEWYWGILAFGPEAQSMPPLVVSPAEVSTASEPASRPTVLAVMAAGLALLGIGLALRRQYAVSGLTIILAAVLAGAFFAGVELSPSVAEANPVAAMDEGAALFVAKGCIVCHVNTDIAQSESTSPSIGPDLTHYSNDPAFLSRWLDKPASVRPATTMPDLGLSADEIDALITFLNGGEGGA